MESSARCIARLKIFIFVAIFFVGFGLAKIFHAEQDNLQNEVNSFKSVMAEISMLMYQRGAKEFVVGFSNDHSSVDLEIPLNKGDYILIKYVISDRGEISKKAYLTSSDGSKVLISCGAYSFGIECDKSSY